MTVGHILAIDDEVELLASMRKILGRAGFTVTTATSGEEGLLALQREEPPDLILSDLMMPGISGMDVLRAVRRKHPETPVVLITAYATVETAIEAIKEGAYDYMPKPFGPDELLVVVERAIGHRRLKDENRRLRAQLGAESGEGDLGLVGESPEMRRLKDLLRRVGPTDLSVMISGESGTGKEVVARAIHRLSSRSTQPFVPVDCAAIPANLMESELFGHEKGAFTGAASLRKGLVEVADRGTFFLDEIGELAAPVQVKLLRLLQEREYRRVGGTRIHAADLRVVAATNRKLDEAVSSGDFREDLFHRLNVVHVMLPPLRDRPDDIPLLLQHFMQRLGVECGRPDLRLGQEVVEVLCAYDWPGNVRELVNCARYVVNLSVGPVINLGDLPPRLRRLDGRRPPPVGGTPATPVPAGESLSGVAIRYDLPYKKSKRLWLEVFEYAYITRLLKDHGGNISHAARAAGIDRKSIQRLMKRNQMVGAVLTDDEA